MPRSRSGQKSKIPRAAATRARYSKKSLSENIKPEVKMIASNTTENNQLPAVVGGAADKSKRRHLSVVDINTREGSKSSINDDVEGERFYTADKGEKINDGPPLDKIVPYERSNGDIFSEQSSEDSCIFLDIKPEEGSQDPLPEGVINIDVDDGLYEYSREVVVYLKGMERTTTVPSSYLDDGSVTPNMRSILVDWLIQVQHHLKLCQESLYLAVGILDLVLHRRDVDPNKLQLVGITALLVASKLEEYYPVDIKKLLHLTENSYTRKEVIHMETVLCEVLDFQVG